MNRTTSFLQRVREKSVMNTDYNIYHSGLFQRNQISQIEYDIRPYVPPVYLEQENMKRRTQLYIDMIQLQHTQESIDLQTLGACVLGSLYSDTILSY